MANHSLPNRNPTNKICSVTECPMLVRSRNLCNRHYTMLLRRGTTQDAHRHGIGATEEERFWSLVDKAENHGPNGECWVWTGSLSYGYGKMHFQRHRRRSTHIAWFLTYGFWHTSPVLRHTCDNPPCVNPDHLLEGTHYDNAQDKVERGRQHSGEQCPFAKLTTEQVVLIRSGRKSIEELVEMLPVTKESIVQIRKGRGWKHVPIS